MSTRETGEQKVPKPISYVQDSFRRRSATFASFESCSSWLTLILLSQTPVLIPEDFNTQVVDPFHCSPKRFHPWPWLHAPTVSRAVPSAQLQFHARHIPYNHLLCTGLLPSGMLTPQAYLPISPASSHLPLYWPFDTTHMPWSIYCICSLARIL